MGNALACRTTEEDDVRPLVWRPSAEQAWHNQEERPWNLGSSLVEFRRCAVGRGGSSFASSGNLLVVHGDEAAPRRR